LVGDKLMPSGLSCHYRPEPAPPAFPIPSPQAFVTAPNPLPNFDGFDPAGFNTSLCQLETPIDCADLFARRIAPFGFDTFASGEIDLKDRSRSTFHILSSPERWAQLCRTSSQSDQNPFADAISQRIAPFTWTELRLDRLLSRAGANALKLAAAAGWTEGLIVPVRQAGGRIGWIGLAGSRVSLRPAEREYLTLLGICLHNHVRTLVGRHGFALPPAGLTPREIDALRLVVQGMSDGAIGRALGVASSTAHEFVEKAKRKMNARSRPELAALAVSLSIVSV
jgi:DNA-binding CsgD family transcriptional regulator